MGKPPWSYVQVRAIEFIDREEDTEGTETSKYLGGKENIPLVVASESGEAQTVAA